MASRSAKLVNRDDWRKKKGDENRISKIVRSFWSHRCGSIFRKLFDGTKTISDGLNRGRGGSGGGWRGEGERQVETFSITRVCMKMRSDWIETPLPTWPCVAMTRSRMHGLSVRIVYAMPEIGTETSNLGVVVDRMQISILQRAGGKCNGER